MWWHSFLDRGSRGMSRRWCMASSLPLIPFQTLLLCNGVSVWWIRTHGGRGGGGRTQSIFHIQVTIFGRLISLTGIFLLNLFFTPPPLSVSSRHISLFDTLCMSAVSVETARRGEDGFLGWDAIVLSSHFTSYIRRDKHQVNCSISPCIVFNQHNANNNTCPPPEEFRSCWPTHAYHFMLRRAET